MISEVLLSLSSTYIQNKIEKYTCKKYKVPINETMLTFDKLVSYMGHSQLDFVNIKIE